MVSRALHSRSGLEERIVHTGQHYDFEMSDLFFSELGIPAPAAHLGVGSGPHGAQTAEMLTKLEQVISDDPPDYALVYGDTNSTLAGALAAAKLHVPVAHVEAGLRSFNRHMPEEINRILTDHLSTILFVPTSSALGNVRDEGIAGSSVHQVGDVMYDATRLFAAAAQRSSILERLGLESGRFVLLTIHRAENTDDRDRLAVILEALTEVSTELPVVLPAHPRIRSLLWERPAPAGSRLIISKPVGYLDMQCLEHSAALIVTDSGGVQKEAFFHRRPCVTLRNETEWVELVELGWNSVVPPTSAARIKEGVLSAIGSSGIEASPYGDGDAASRIACVLATG